MSESNDKRTSSVPAGIHPPIIEEDCSKNFKDNISIHDEDEGETQHFNDFDYVQVLREEAQKLKNLQNQEENEADKLMKDIEKKQEKIRQDVEELVDRDKLNEMPQI